MLNEGLAHAWWYRREPLCYFRRKPGGGAKNAGAQFCLCVRNAVRSICLVFVPGTCPPAHHADRNCPCKDGSVPDDIRSGVSLREMRLSVRVQGRVDG
jgi:hypothetical protein